MKTLYISDLDGTLLDRNGQLSEYSADALNRLVADGCNFSVATARGTLSTNVVMTGVDLNIPIALFNGVMLYDMRQNKYLEVNYLKPKAVGEIIGALRANGVSGIMYEIKDEILNAYYELADSESLQKFMDERTVRYKQKFTHVSSFSHVVPEKIVYLTLFDTKERLRPVYDTLCGSGRIGMTMYPDNYSGLWYLEFYSVEASKRAPLLRLREMFGYERIVCFGDNLNDLPMFEAADVKIAVANAHEDVKAAADFTCDTNENNGVVKWILSDMGR